MTINTTDLQMLTCAQQIDFADQLQNDQQPNVPAMPDIQAVYNTPLASLPLFLLHQRVHARDDELKLRSETLVNFITTTFEQRVAGDAVVLLKESEEGITTTLQQFGTCYDGCVFPFGRTVAHYAFFYKWRPAIEYICENRMASDLTRMDVLGLTPLDYYFMNIADGYVDYVISIQGHDRHADLSVLSYNGQVYRFDCIYNKHKKQQIASKHYAADFYIYSLLKQTGMLQRAYKILECIYYNQRRDYQVYISQNKDEHEHRFIGLAEAQFYYFLHEVFEDFMHHYDDISKSKYYDVLSKHQVSIKIWREDTLEKLPKEPLSKVMERQ